MRTAAWRFQAAAALGVGLLSVGVASGQIFIDDFESGTDLTNIPNTGPWRVNDSGRPAQYRSANNPFASGQLYAYLNDDQAATGVGFRFLSTNAADAGGFGPQIGGKVTTFSFDFWESLPDVDTPNQPGMAFGYYSPGMTGTGIDLNAANRSFRALLHNGFLSPDQLLAGDIVPYDREKVHTIYMIANDSAAAVENYRGAETLEPDQADVWISLDGAEPTFAFSVAQQNSGFAPWGIGFRAFTFDIEEFLIDNVLLVDGASFDRSIFDGAESVPGDYNNDGVADGIDFLEWQRQFGLEVDPSEGADGSGNGLVDGADLNVWATSFGEFPGGVEGVPEPCLVAMLLPLLCLFRRRGIRSRD